jgi:hypothetical protein
VSIFENPIFITQKRLAHRAGVLAPILIAALIGLSLLSGLIAYLADPRDFNFSSPQEAGKMFYGWTIGVEILLLWSSAGSAKFRARWPRNARPGFGTATASRR